MSALIPFPINPPPGVVVTESQRVAEGRWIPPFDKISFVKAKAQKIVGQFPPDLIADVGHATGDPRLVRLPADTVASRANP